MRAQRSLRWIQLIHCRPSPIGPPNPVRKTGSILPNAAISSQHNADANRYLTGRRWNAAAASQRAQSDARKSSPSALDSKNRAVVLVP